MQNKTHEVRGSRKHLWKRQTDRAEITLPENKFGEILCCLSTSNQAEFRERVTPTKILGPFMELSKEPWPNISSCLGFSQAKHLFLDSSAAGAELPALLPLHKPA